MSIGIASVASPAPRNEWHEIASADPEALIEHMPIWLDALKAAGGFRDVSRLYRLTDGRRFVLPLVTKVPRYGPRSGFGSGWGIGGVVGPGLDAAAVSAIVDDLAADRAVYTHIRPNPLQADAWAEADTGKAQLIARRAHVVDLSGGAEATRARFRKSGERGVRKAEKMGVEVTVHVGGEKLDVYYESLYLGAIERWAARQNEPVALARFRALRRDPLHKLEAMASTLGPAFRMFLASVDGVPAAANIVLWGPTNAHATRGALAYDIGAKTNASYAADWVAIRDACDAGYSSYHMGETGQNKPLADYKERFGARAVDYNEVRLERLPLLAIDKTLRTAVKRVIGFKD